MFIIGDSRRPYPIDIEMRAGILGKLTEYNTDSDEKVNEMNNGNLQHFAHSIFILH